VLLRRLAPLAGIVALVAVPAVRADADPASDILYTQRIYLPFFNGKVSPEHAQTLKGVVDDAWAKGYQVKVALIPGDKDLGGVYQLYGKPQEYADFLGRELIFLFKGRLLVVMPQGFGVYRYQKPVTREQAQIKDVPITAGPDGLADAASVAVATLAGLPAPDIAASSGSSSSGTPAWEVAVIAVGGALLVAAMVAFTVLVVRRRRT
jgi:hypothetical protein